MPPATRLVVKRPSAPALLLVVRSERPRTVGGDARSYREGDSASGATRNSYARSAGERCALQKTGSEVCSGPSVLLASALSRRRPARRRDRVGTRPTPRA